LARPPSWRRPSACSEWCGGSVARAAKGGVHTLRELRRGSSHGGLDSSVDRFGTDVGAFLQPRTHLASLIDAAQGVRRLRQAHLDPPHPGAEPAQGQQHAPHHLSAQDFGEAAIGARHIDPQYPASGIGLELPLVVDAQSRTWQGIGPILLYSTIHRALSMYSGCLESLNHHHLFHFWTVVREGAVTRASEKLHISQPTISGQLRELEEALGEKLLARAGRMVVLTDIGRTVYRYADEMLGLDRELLAAVKGRPTRPGKLAVGVAMVVPKLVAYQMLEPALRLPEPIQLDCIHERPERLLA
jgi:hypothetical protein